MDSLKREKGDLERDNLQLRKKAEELELSAHQAIERARIDERTSLLAEIHVSNAACPSITACVTEHVLASSPVDWRTLLERRSSKSIRQTHQLSDTPLLDTSARPFPH